MKKCKSCGRVVGKDAEHCDYCGADVLPEKKFLESEQHEPVIESENVCPHCGNETLEGGVCDICNYGTTYCPKCESFSSHCESFCPDCGTPTIPGPEYIKMSPPSTCAYCGKSFYAYLGGDACDSCREKMIKANSQELCSDCCRALGRKKSGSILYNVAVVFLQIFPRIKYTICSIFIIIFLGALLRGYWSLIPVVAIIIGFNIKYVKNMRCIIRCFKCGKKEVSKKKVIYKLVSCVIRIAIPVLAWICCYSVGFIQF